jgi:hypothetical protein
MLPLLARVAREARSGTDVELKDVAYWSRISEATISRFENGKIRTWPTTLDAIIGGYAKALEREPAWFWLRAAELMHENTGPPVAA